MKKILALLLTFCMCILGIPVLPVQAQSNAVLTGYADLSDEVMQEGGYLSEAPSEEERMVSLSEADPWEDLKEHLIAAWRNFDASCDVSGFGVTTDDLQEVYGEVLNENYQYFYVSASYRYSYNPMNNTVITITISYNMDQEEAETKLAALETVVAMVLDNADPSWSDMEKALYINDYLARNCEYDTTYSRSTAYDALVEQTAVCQGYALAYQLLARQMGLSCELVTSAALNHAWNLVKIGEHYYHVDPTWNDPTTDLLGRAKHSYFVKSSSYFRSEEGQHGAEDWVISGNPDLAADDTTYDDWFWDEINTGFEYVNGSWYGIQDSKLCSYRCDGNQFTLVKELQSIADTWQLWGNPSACWSGSYYSLASFGDQLYYTRSGAIYEYDPATEESAIVYELSEEQKENGYIYGMAMNWNYEMKFLLATGPNEISSGTINTAFQFEPVQIKLSGCAVSVEETGLVYDGNPKLPEVTVKYGYTTLVEDRDYTVTYDDNVNAGTATVTVTGIGDYTGSVSKTFSIGKAEQTLTAVLTSTTLRYGNTGKVTVQGTGDITYTSSDSSVVTVSDQGEIAAKGAGTATITVKALGDSNYNPAEKKLSITVQYATPAISSAVNQSTGVKVTWAKVNGAKKYRVYRKTSGGSWEKLADTTVTSYTDQSAKSGTAYSYTVCCINDAGTSSTSSYHPTGKSIVRLSQAEPTLTNTSNGVKVSWKKVKGAARYEVYRKTASGEWKKIKSTTSASVTDKTAKNGKTYYYTVKAYNGSSVSSFVTTKKIVRLTTPVISNVVNHAKRKVTVKWSKNTSASGYQIKYVTGSTTKTKTVSGKKTVKKVLTNLVRKKSYKIYVRSYTTVSGTKYYSAWSKKKTVKVLK